MVKVNDSDYVVEPEALYGLGVNWEKYSPPGGYKWQENYRTIGKEGLGKARDVIVKRKNEIATYDIDFAKLRSGISNLRELLDAFENPVGKKFLDRNPNVSHEWLANTKYMCDAFECVENGLGVTMDERMAIETDLAFVDAIEKFFDADLETDMLLFAISKVDKKFRTKVLRTVMKSLKDVEDAMLIINNTNSSLKEPMFKMWYGEPYTYLSKGYSRVGLSVRNMKKALDKKGPSFWDIYTPDEFLGTIENAERSVEQIASVSEWAFGNSEFGK